MTAPVLPPPTQPAIDTVTGKWTTPWYKYLSDAQTYYNNGRPSGFFHVNLSTHQSVVAGATTTLLTFDTEEYDTNLWFDTTTSSYTPQEAGYYQFYVQAYTTRNATGETIEPFILRNSSYEAGGVYVAVQTTTAGGSISGASHVHYMNGTTDVVNFRVLCPSTRVVADARYTFAYGQKIGST